MSGDIEKKKAAEPGGSKRGGRELAPFGAAYVALLTAGVLGALLVYLLLVNFVPGAGESRLEAMKTALLVVAGSGAGAGLYVQYRKQHTDEAKSALDHANSRRDQDKLFTERYTQAVAQLGNVSASVRLGGVYALARIADDSERDRPTCLSVLCAHLRLPYDPDAENADTGEREVRETAQTVLAERLRPAHPGFWPGADINLRRACLIYARFDGITVKSALFSRARFIGPARFTGATFTDAGVFSQATFTADARFDGATFAKRAIFDHAVFSGRGSFIDAAFGEQPRFLQATFAEPDDIARLPGTPTSP